MPKEDRTKTQRKSPTNQPSPKSIRVTPSKNIQRKTQHGTPFFKKKPTRSSSHFQTQSSIEVDQFSRITQKMGLQSIKVEQQEVLMTSQMNSKGLKDSLFYIKNVLNKETDFQIIEELNNLEQLKEENKMLKKKLMNHQQESTRANKLLQSLKVQVAANKNHAANFDIEKIDVSNHSSYKKLNREISQLKVNKNQVHEENLQLRIKNQCIIEKLSMNIKELQQKDRQVIQLKANIQTLEKQLTLFKQSIDKRLIRPQLMIDSKMEQNKHIRLSTEEQYKDRNHQNQDQLPIKKSQQLHVDTRYNENLQSKSKSRKSLSRMSSFLDESSQQKKSQYKNSRLNTDPEINNVYQNLRKNALGIAQHEYKKSIFIDGNSQQQFNLQTGRYHPSFQRNTSPSAQSRSSRNREAYHPHLLTLQPHTKLKNSQYSTKPSLYSDNMKQLRSKNTSPRQVQINRTPRVQTQNIQSRLDSLKAQMTQEIKLLRR